MAFSPPQTDTHRKSAAHSVRNAIALALDGVLPPDGRDARTAYRAAIEPASIAFDRQLLRLRQLGQAGLVAATTRFDDTHRFLAVLGVTAVSPCSVPELSQWPGVVFVGCLGATDANHNHWIEGMLARGAVIVSSDTSAGLPVIASGLSSAKRQSGRRARATVSPDIAEAVAGAGEWGHFVVDMHPALWLAPGHLPLTHEQRVGVTTIAHDTLVGEPLVVLADVNGGQVLHSVAHWWQGWQPDSMELGLRYIASIRPFAFLGLAHREASLGSFGAASVLLACLLNGLDIALDMVERLGLCPGTAVASVED
ncbi:MAG: hypothetical protein M3439_04550 [Chloroflexota bacterium]|nr:hypothetical protein [Chloroflexota bacterium]